MSILGNLITNTTNGITLLPGLGGGIEVNLGNGGNTPTVGVEVLPDLSTSGTGSSGSSGLLDVGLLTGGSGGSLLDVDLLPGTGSNTGSGGGLGGLLPAIGVDLDLLPGLGVNVGVNTPATGTGGGGTGGGGTGGGGGGGNGGGGNGDDGSGDTDGDGTNGVINEGGAGIGGTGWVPGGSVRIDLEAAYQNITRVDAASAKAAGDAAALTAIYNAVQAKTMSEADGVRGIIKFAADTSSVAVASYQFFTGKTPGVDGLDYLVNSVDSTNPRDLNDAYYQAFNVENRYINFASNLGLSGEGSVTFKATYGALSFAEAVREIYDEVIGIDFANAAGINAAAGIADIVSRKGYFDTLASQRIGSADTDIASKAAVAGYILAEAIKADVGLYANALENFYFDLADSQAQHNINLVAVYTNDAVWMA